MLKISLIEELINDLKSFHGNKEDYNIFVIKIEKETGYRYVCWERTYDLILSTIL